jgi:predicted nucleic acid-binding protein
MRQIVLDTSVIVKWFSNESNSDKAVLLLQLIADEKISLVIPDICLAEIANALRYNNDFTQAKTQKAIKYFLQLNPAIEPINTIINNAIIKAYKNDLAIYDASFIALAEVKDILIITSDYKHHKKEISKNLIWLKELDMEEIEMFGL